MRPQVHVMKACNEQNGNLHKRFLKVRMKPASQNVPFVPHHSFAY